MTTGKRINQLRLDRDLNKSQLARALGVHRYTVINWEGGKYLPHWANLQQLAEYFRVSVKYLLYGENGPQSPVSERSEPEAG